MKVKKILFTTLLLAFVFSNQSFGEVTPAQIQTCQAETTAIELKIQEMQLEINTLTSLGKLASAEQKVKLSKLKLDMKVQNTSLRNKKTFCKNLTSQYKKDCKSLDNNKKLAERIFSKADSTFKKANSKVFSIQNKIKVKEQRKVLIDNQYAVRISQINRQIELKNVECAASFLGAIFGGGVNGEACKQALFVLTQKRQAEENRQKVAIEQINQQINQLNSDLTIAQAAVLEATNAVSIAQKDVDLATSIYTTKCSVVFF